MKITKEQLKQLIKEELNGLDEGHFPKTLDVRGPEGEPTGQRLSEDHFIMVDEDSLMKVGELVEFAVSKGQGNWLPETYAMYQGQLVPKSETPLGRMQAKAPPEEDRWAAIEKGVAP